VSSYVLDDPVAQSFLEHLEAMLRFLIPQFEKERRSYLTIGVGCTGGRHRSVAVALRLRDFMTKLGYAVNTRHRDIQHL
ncbi:MAG: RNase adaptor protein RapZ, partial [Anaerolineales bacterium]